MKSAKPSITSFVLFMLVVALAIAVVARLFSETIGAEPLYDEYRDVVHLVLIAVPAWWAFRKFGVHQRLRERGHIR